MEPNDAKQPNDKPDLNAAALGSDGRRALSAAPARTGVEPIPPSNTIGDKYNPEYFKPLRWGVDSVYLTYSGELFPETLTRLNALKKLAQSSEDNDIALAQYPIEGHAFEVKDKGVKLFPFILSDGAFYIQLSKGGKLPMAFVQVSSHYLTHVGPEAAEEKLTAILAHLGNLTSVAHVNRIDLYADFVSPDNKEWDREAWVTRAAGIDRYSENGIFTGWVIGKGGVMLARMYYKLLQAVKSGLDYLLPLWQEGGWKADEHVWRLEFQIKRDVLKEMGIVQLSDTLKHLDGLWSYATTEWLKLTVPSPEDQNRSRWPIHPLWGYLSSIDWKTPGGSLLRTYSPTRTPKPEQLYVRYFSPIVSYMAMNGLEDIYEGGMEMMNETIAHFTGRAALMGLPFDEYVRERIAMKRREFNTGINDTELAERIAAETLERQMAAYRRAKDGN